MRKISLNLRRDGIEARYGNLIARELITHPLPVGNRRYGGIVDCVLHNRPSQWIGTELPPRQHAGEISDAKIVNGYGGDISRDAAAVDVFFDIEEEEGFVPAVVNLGNVDRPAQAGA